MNCPLCKERKSALSSLHVRGSHVGLHTLNDAAVDAGHRIRTDAGRFTERWFHGLLEQGLKDVEYVEIISVVAIVSAIDTFDRALGRPTRQLPSPIPGAPTQRRPRGAKPGLGWLETVAPEDLADDDPNPYERFGAFNIQRALSLVPAEVIAFFELDVEL